MGNFRNYMMSFSKLHEAASRFRLSKSKVLAGGAVLAIAAYGVRKYGPTACHYVGLKYDDEVVMPGSAEHADGSVSEGQNSVTAVNSASVSAAQKRISVNDAFCKQLVHLLRIIIPGLWTKECALLALHTASLVSRTFLSVYVAQLDGYIVKAIVQRDVRRFVLMLALWLGIAVPATFVNSFIRFLANQLGLAMRSRLVQHAYQMYFHSQTYYRSVNMSLCFYLQVFFSAFVILFSFVI